MLNTKVQSLVNAELGGYKQATSAYNPSYAPTEWELLELIDLYWIDKFRDGDTTLSGWKRVFYNAVFNPTLVSSKMIDFDTKDVQVKAVDGASYYPAWFYSRDLNTYMREKDFGCFLNDLVYNYPKYGSIVVKKVGEEVYCVPLKNIAWDIDVNDLEDSGFIIEKHVYTPAGLRRQKWDKKAIEKAIELAGGAATQGVVENFGKESISNEKRIEVYERFGSVEGETDNYFIISKEGVVLAQAKFAEVDELYRKLDWDRIPGRMLGRGTVEKLFEAQIQINRVANYKTEGLHWSSKHIFQTRDVTFGKNLKDDVENGEVLNPNSEITPVSMEERNLSAYMSEENRWDALVKNLSFSYSEVAGERPPAGTPLGTSVLQTQQAGAFFDLKREDLGLFIREIILDWIIPSFEKNSATQHSVMMHDFDTTELGKVKAMLAEHRANGDIINFIIRSGKIPDAAQADLIKALAKTKSSKEKEIIIPKDFYKNLEYKIDVILTNEQIDVAARMTTLQTVLGLLGSQPGLLENPRTKNIFYKLLDMAGFSPVDLGMDDESPQDVPSVLENLRPGGSVARPAAPQASPTMMSKTTTV